MTAAAVQDPPGRVRIARLDRSERDRLQRNALRLASILVHFNQPSVNAGGSGGGRFRRRLEFGYDLGGPGGASPRHRAWPSRRRSPRRPAPPRSPSPRSIPAESPCPKPLAPHWTSRRDRCRTPHQRARRHPSGREHRPAHAEVRDPERSGDQCTAGAVRKCPETVIGQEKAGALTAWERATASRPKRSR